ncbi:MAG TPA: adenosylcobinamide-GDP ribazoletransferase [Anaeromyxobacter sp.]|nr:adenosylcobinamide-GDP ribazoletransferase [Anaeromyxobacter sp.]
MSGAPAPLRHLLAAFHFLTRFPVPGPAPQEADLGRSLAFFPVPGVVLGALLAGAARLVGDHLAPAVVAPLLVAALAWLSGALHLDGLADLADGLGGGHRDPARTLSIMRDSRIGAFGAVAVILLLLVKTASVAELVKGGGAWALLCAPALARFTAVPLVVLFPYARPEGLGRPFHAGGGPRELAVAAVITAAILAVAGKRALFPTAVALGVALVLALAIRHRLGGLTGDVYGAAMELAETAFLACAGMR